MADHEHLCLLTALSPRRDGPNYFSYRGDELKQLTRTMAKEVVAILGEDDNIDTIKAVIEESLEASSSRQGAAWLEEHLGRPRDNAWPPEPLNFEDIYFDTAVVIGYDEHRTRPVLRRVNDFNFELNCWNTLLLDSKDGGETRILAQTADGLQRGDPFFCWERPYQYFEAWMRPSLTSRGIHAFIDDFFRLVDSNRPTSADDDDDDCSGLLKCISYGGIEKAYNGSFQWTFAEARTGSAHTAAAIAAGARRKDLWPAFAEDFGTWMAMRPDIWPCVPSGLLLASSSTIELHAEHAGPSVFHKIPPEVFIQILRLLSLPDLRVLLQLSHTISGLVRSLLDETLWHHVHHGDLRWILPVEGVKGEVDRANDAARGWYSHPSGFTSVLDSREFPFARFISACVRSSSMRNRHRLWKIYKQYKVLWEAME
ncbi:hypothetical protein DFH08DRAFT_753930 [Mycena albidolilacea]|uniref:F-box domain-containing protein n=1 Tax=Mycena albidolilacea TaxID=1033008 RepID=A0AAD7EFV3_9AGAR|nr:hypothetical protein DFH08DRAFT_753930 [Mycena albidolilacea]